MGKVIAHVVGKLVESMNYSAIWSITSSFTWNGHSRSLTSVNSFRFPFKRLASLLSPAALPIPGAGGEMKLLR